MCIDNHYVSVVVVLVVKVYEENVLAFTVNIFCAGTQRGSFRPFV